MAQENDETKAQPIDSLGDTHFVLVTSPRPDDEVFEGERNLVFLLLQVVRLGLQTSAVVSWAVFAHQAFDPGGNRVLGWLMLVVGMVLWNALREARSR